MLMLTKTNHVLFIDKSGRCILFCPVNEKFKRIGDLRDLQKAGFCYGCFSELAEFELVDLPVGDDTGGALFELLFPSLAKAEDSSINDSIKSPVSGYCPGAY